MHCSTILLPLLAFTASALAAPTPLGAVVRAVPNLREVIRNPAPIDSRIAAKLKALGLSVGLEIGTRETPALEAEIEPPSKIV
jgi:hypothetical protein